MTASGYLAAASALPMYWSSKKGFADALPVPGGQLSDPAIQPKFKHEVPNALSPTFIFDKEADGKYIVKVARGVTQTGLVDPSGNSVPTAIYGYGTKNRNITWPGKTIQVRGDREPVTQVIWENNLPLGQPHLLPIDTSLHWCYSLHGYTDYTLETAGVPIISHLLGGNTDFQFDGNPEFFFGPEIVSGSRRRKRKSRVVGPQWSDVPEGFTNKFTYNTSVPAGSLWYHDHALGLTRMNVYAGLAGFFFVRDEDDTGDSDNKLGLPYGDHELALAIQDRMFRPNGDLFYPAFPGEPFYDDFIETPLPGDVFPGGGPTALAEFFGDHIVVNGIIWPKATVENRTYRLRLLNGCDSRFLVVRLGVAGDAAGEPETLSDGAERLNFQVIGSDQGLGNPKNTDTLVFEPGARYDILIDFSSLQGKRVIMENTGYDAPFGGDFGKVGGVWPEGDVFDNRQTDRIMAFDVTNTASGNTLYVANPYEHPTKYVTEDRTRKVALFEGMDEYGRLQPLLGTAEPATDFNGDPINWPDTTAYREAGLTGQMEGSIAWHSPTTENPKLGDTEIWEIYNATGDAHPIHLHLVNFEVLDRRTFTANVVDQKVVQHNGEVGDGFLLTNIQVGGLVDPGIEYVEDAPKDMVTALPDQVTRIRATFDKPGRYVWHCHILSHEDHEMMRVLEVTDPTPPDNGGGDDDKPNKPKRRRR